MPYKKSAALEQEIAAAKRTFDRAAESEPALIQRVMDCSKNGDCVISSVAELAHLHGSCNRSII